MLHRNNWTDLESVSDFSNTVALLHQLLSATSVKRFLWIDYYFQMISVLWTHLKITIWKMFGLLFNLIAYNIIKQTFATNQKVSFNLSIVFWLFWADLKFCSFFLNKIGKLYKIISSYAKKKRLKNKFILTCKASLNWLLLATANIAAPSSIAVKISTITKNCKIECTNVLLAKNYINKIIHLLWNYEWLIYHSFLKLKSIFWKLWLAAEHIIILRLNYF